MSTSQCMAQQEISPKSSLIFLFQGSTALDASRKKHRFLLQLRAW